MRRRTSPPAHEVEGEEGDGGGAEVGEEGGGQAWGAHQGPLHDPGPSGVVWCGVAWSGAVWCDMVVWCAMLWCCVVLFGVMLFGRAPEEER